MRPIATKGTRRACVYIRQPQGWELLGADSAGGGERKFIVGCWCCCGCSRFHPRAPRSIPLWPQALMDPCLRLRACLVVHTTFLSAPSHLDLQFAVAAVLQLNRMYLLLIVKFPIRLQKSIFLYSLQHLARPSRGPSSIWDSRPTYLVWEKLRTESLFYHEERGRFFHASDPEVWNIAIHNEEVLHTSSQRGPFFWLHGRGFAGVYNFRVQCIQYMQIYHEQVLVFFEVTTSWLYVGRRSIANLRTHTILSSFCAVILPSSSS